MAFVGPYFKDPILRRGNSLQIQLTTIQQLFICTIMTMELHSNQRIELAETFGLLSDPTRLAIILVCLEQERSAGEIATKLDVSQSLVSHHLRLLRAARMLRSERRGKQIFYEMADECVRDVLKIMINHLFVHENCDPEEA